MWKAQHSRRPPKSLWSTPSTYAQSFAGKANPSVWPAFWTRASAMPKTWMDESFYLYIIYGNGSSRVSLAAELDMLGRACQPARKVPFNPPTCRRNCGDGVSGWAFRKLGHQSLESSDFPRFYAGLFDAKTTIKQGRLRTKSGTIESVEANNLNTQIVFS